MTENLGIGDIAASPGVHHSYASRLIRLAFLNPEITEAILDGRQPLGLTAAKLMQVSRLPLEWRASSRRRTSPFSPGSGRVRPAKRRLRATRSTK